MNIVVVEDHQDLRELFVQHLLRDGFHVVGVNCGEELDDYLANATVDLLILDLNLPGENGLDIARRMRAAHTALSIIMLTARTSESDRIIGYESGADLYLPKPISAQELSAAVKAVDRRLRSTTEMGSLLTLNLSRMVMVSSMGEVSLSKSDTSLLKALASAPDRRLAYWRLFEVTERGQSELAKGQLELQVYRLRRKLAEIGIDEDLIKAVRREGYQLTQPLNVQN
jgi:DNA-binding response OmpR family regulator